jgi:hypothetical protein
MTNSFAVSKASVGLVAVLNSGLNPNIKTSRTKTSKMVGSQWFISVPSRVRGIVADAFPSSHELIHHQSVILFPHLNTELR